MGLANRTVHEKILAKLILVGVASCVLAPFAHATPSGVDQARQKLQQAKATTKKLGGLSVRPLARFSPFRDRSLLTPEVKAQLTTIRDYVRLQSTLSGKLQVVKMAPRSDEGLAITGDGEVGQIHRGVRNGGFFTHVGALTVPVAGQADPTRVLKDIAKAASEIERGNGERVLSDL